MAEGKTVAVGVPALGIGAFAGFTLDPAKGLELLKWLSTEIGPVGFVLLLSLGAALGISVVTNWLFWVRLKEKDEECEASTDRQRQAWKAVVDQMTSDNKEGIKNVADLIKQVTILTERAAPVATRQR